MKGLKLLLGLGAPLMIAPAAALAEAVTAEPEAVAQTQADSEYLGDLYSFLQSRDSMTYLMATQAMDPEDSVWAARMFCETFAAGVSPGEAFSVYSATAMNQATARGVNLTEEMAYAVGLYGGAVMSLGSAHYCPQHHGQVQAALSEL